MTRLWPILILAASTLAFAKADTPASTARPANLTTGRELTAWRQLIRGSEFSDVPHITNSPTSCAAVQPPQALTTPVPLMSRNLSSSKAKVSFIIGIDGRVHSPLILESAGASGDRSILRTVRTWKYRPGTCNGVPTETEGKIEFSSR
ncbi:MAG TPA: energy transducer TonB [Candidatus Sulfotelmatobacter sp.]